MIDAWIRLDDQKSPGPRIKRAGDVVLVTLQGAPGGSRQDREFQRVEWEDADLEARLAAMAAAGEPYPKIGQPYAELNEDGQLVQQSLEYVDLQKLPPGIRAQVLDKSIAVPRLPLAILTRRSRAASAPASLRSRRP